MRTCAGSDAYRLADLQAYVVRWPPEHYSAQGREPLLYAIVLLLTLQPRTAVAFLARHASTGSFRVDSVHLAIALVHHQVGFVWPRCIDVSCVHGCGCSAQAR